MIFIYVAVSIVAGYIAIITTAYVMQNRFLFRSTRDLTRTPEEMGWGFEEARLDVDGHKTLVWHVPARKSTDRAILFSHGNAGNLSDRLESISIFRDMGYDVIAYDYGGYGVSTGKASESRCYADLRAVWFYTIDELGFRPENIVLFGRSLGAGPTAQIATEVNPGVVVLESTFTSVPAITRIHYPFLPGFTMSRNRFDTLAKVDKIASPILVVHGKKDTLIPYSHGKEIFDQANEPKAFLDIDGEHHEGFWMSGSEYTEGLNTFFDQHLGRST